MAFYFQCDSANADALIMVGQNLQGRHAKARAESDFCVNVKAENEIEIILLHLENQDQLILEILRHLEAFVLPTHRQHQKMTPRSP